ncbi:MAG: chemotaxis protein CheW, partial [Magnetococcales bacterium]|nr:chemotaxis protein CheW [Magnetococcales bacterium]
MFDPDVQRELLTEFFSENREALHRIEADLLRLEGSPPRGELSPLVHSVFRNMHTVKGNCRMMDFGRLESLTHEAENLLDHLREGRIPADSTLCGVLFQVLDAVRSALDHLERTGREGEENARFADLTQQMRRIHESADQAYIFGRESPHAEEADASGEGGEEAEEDDDSGEALDLGPLPVDDASSPASSSSSSVAAPQNARLRSVQLSIERLDQLMDLVGELNAAFNHLQYSFTRHPEQAAHSLEMMEQQLQQLQHEVLQYRLQPIGRIWESYHRLVRDLAVATGKKILLELEGSDTEVDRNILLALKESLGHILRNAADHGIESPAERVAAGKSPVGVIRMSAAQSHGQIHLEIADDGRGVDLARVRDKALALGLISPERAREAPEEEILHLVMLPGFSTAAQVSALSGRGAGMDVVKSAVEKVGGAIHLASTAGRGTRIRLRIPQTVSIVPALLVRNGDASYAAPQVNVVEMVSYYGPDVAHHVEGKMRHLMVRVRDRLLPLLRLDRLLASQAQTSDDASLDEIRSAPELNVAVLQSEEHLFALAVDHIDEPANLVIKPLPRALRRVAILAGAALMPDGSVCFLLNVAELHRFLE